MGKILLVEDEMWQGKLCSQELRESGYEVDWVTSGEDALATSADNTYDLVILDIYLPGMDGLETMGRILSKDRTVPVILYTAYSTYQDNFLSWAADAYVVKSADLTELKDTIRRVLGDGRDRPRASKPSHPSP
ncbi:MAG TPA: response regulator [Thermoanaerobaculia bacterium]|nr:response regulator [Thermoanaerobaculia bacterium]HUM29888.1 response regulator [Thermoanaerobaculia bacterium]HXK68245.1 response regulator [Thermoanaerobaculia bacterium]